MKKLSNTVKITALISICLWIIGSIILFDEKNGKTIILLTAVVIIAGLFSQISKERKLNSEG
ncbi:hypothetical protein [Flavobacterium degerlachei]|jgi:uncharacterized membrane protein YbaN (DUF454 family)|uniref:Uncharacterized protein n=1 Tax=Flavobacterium degerlachei TaxID=229203 RepID=A0A1H2TTL2_9FLAO|nr:hypothetical protein [Flavobacterium degerlachei]SDW47117.1 hypothetical protein SAMN05444338_1032 [Flavobacterium degerlachei]